MKKHQFKLRLQPLDDGAFTQVHLWGPVVTALPPCELRRWLTQLSRWSDSPVELALPVDVSTVAWFELWSYAISDIAARHLQVKFTLKRRLRRRRPDVSQ